MQKHGIFFLFVAENLLEIGGTLCFFTRGNDIASRTRNMIIWYNLMTHTHTLNRSTQIHIISKKYVKMKNGSENQQKYRPQYCRHDIAKNMQK